MGTVAHLRKDAKPEKKSKKEKKLALADEVAEPVVADVVEETVEVEESKKKRKKSKKKSKEASEEKPSSAVADSAEADTEEVVSEKKKKKKSKKKNKEAAAEAEEPKAEEKKEKKRKAEVEAEPAKKRKRSGASGPYQQPGPDDNSFRKAFYSEMPKLAEMTQEEVQAFHEANAITISGPECYYRPVRRFDEIELPTSVKAAVSGFERPTPIQSQCWPIVLSGRDIIGIAETGSGKTLAFTIPAIIHTMDQRPISKKAPGPIVLVVVPTRELAMQVNEVVSSVATQNNFKTLCIYGGVPKYNQRQALKDGVHFVVATPGRLKDLIEDNSCSLSRVTYLVLDEADRMLDDGFEKDIRFIISKTHKQRQIVMFSATWPESIQSLAHEFLVEPVKVTIGSDDLAANKRVKQIVEVVEDRQRDRRVCELLQTYHKSKKNRVLIFVLYKKEAVRVERMLQSRGWKCVAIHGDKTQQDRTRAVEQFKSGEIPLLLATDVAARGLDIPDVEYVINYSFPLTIEDYVHRIGRTGRGGKDGISHTFFQQTDKLRAGELVNVLKEADQEVPSDLLKFGCHVKKKEHKLYGAFSKDVDMSKKGTKITFGSDEE